MELVWMALTKIKKPPERIVLGQRDWLDYLFFTQVACW
jgi:hypothetical protein